MDLETFSFSKTDGWSQDFPAIDSDQTLLVAFGAPAFSKSTLPLTELAGAFPRSHVLGCSTAGEFIGDDLRDDSIVVAALRFESTRLRTADIEPVSSAGCSFAAGKGIAESLADPSLRAVLLLSDGLAVNGSELVKGLREALPPSVIATGGLAADGDRFQHTWILDDMEPRGGAVSAVGLYGDDLRVGHGSKGGWDIFGPERTITRSHENVLFELDGRPALSLYKEYLGDLAADLPASGLLFPLALRSEHPDGDSIVRTILAVEENDEALVFAGDMPEGARAQLMRANFDRLVEGAAGAAEMTGCSSWPEAPTLALGISCVGRRLVLGERAEEEIESTLDSLSPDVQQIGFYSYGEISPQGAGSCELHNQTMTLTTISEAPVA